MTSINEEEVLQTSTAPTPTSNPNSHKKQKKLKGKKSKKTVTPEYIAEQRALREAKKAEKQAKLLAQGVDVSQLEISPAERFIVRPFLELPKDVVADKKEKSIEFKIMTYNILAQTLIRRKLFPTNGDALKWNRRSKVIHHELVHYDPDIICLQEADHVQFTNFWKKDLDRLEYDTKYYRWPGKTHGVAICWKKKLFELDQSMPVHYESEITDGVERTFPTTNVALNVALKIKNQDTASSNGKEKGIIVGTTHLFWHPFGTYERTRQCYIFLSKAKEFQDRVSHSSNNQSVERNLWPVFLAGDFNSQPFDAPYLSMTSKPINYDGRCRRVLECSYAYDFEAAEKEKKERKLIAAMIERGEIPPETKNDGTVKQPLDPVPDNFKGNEKTKQAVNSLKNLYDKLPLKTVSLYSWGYKYVHSQNSGRDNDRGEPFFSNWAHSWRGLLDYIMILQNDINEKSEKEVIPGIRLRKLLRMPEPEEMGEEPSGQPREGQYPSDHLCMMAQVELDL